MICRCHPLLHIPVNNGLLFQVTMLVSGRRRIVNGVPRWTVLLVLVLWLVSGGTVVAQTGGLDHSPAELVKKYFELDQKGAKLDSLSFEALAPYRHWESEPAWGKVIVIRGFSVAEHYRDWEVVDRLEVVIPVTFEVLGSVYLETAGFLPESQVETIQVRVKAVRNRWRIMEPVLPPHVGQKRMINFVLDELRKAK